MRIISTGYSKTYGYNDPAKWLERINFYSGILDELAKQHYVLSIERIEYDGECIKNNVHYHFIPLKGSRVLFPARMHRLIRQKKPDVVLVNGLIFPLQVMQLRATLGKKPKIILLHRADKPFIGYKKHWQKLADKCINAYLFTSSEFGDAWKKNINVKKIHEVILVSSVFNKSNSRADQDKNRHKFLWVGNLNSNKDPVTVINAFKKFSQHEPGANLYMIYQSDELLEEVKRYAGDGKFIHLVGKVEHSELQSWYTSADFIISSSHYESGGVAVCEAMSCGCIPILTNIISFRKITGPGKCGLLFEAGNENDLFRCLMKTKEMDVEKERKKTIEQFNRELSFLAIARKIDKVIESLTKN
ncbi:MAG TPA: glycosyltransferase family 4 protein [Chitinophagaceae bacterium]|nr:glycosyltransferase family 4 protein [Chitinophagaceae bacterium]